MFLGCPIVRTLIDKNRWGLHFGKPGIKRNKSKTKKAVCIPQFMRYWLSRKARMLSRS